MKTKVKLWLDDIRDPVQHGRLGWVWARTYDEAIALFENWQLDVVEASLDHDLTPYQSVGYSDGVNNGYHVVRWMIDNNYFPRYGVTVHSANPVGSKRMVEDLKDYCYQHGLNPDLVKKLPCT